VINQSYLSSWNNKQAPGYRAAEDNYSYGPNHRVQSLDERIQAGIAGGNTMNLPELIDAMEDGGSVDLRGSQVLPLMLRVITSSGPLTAAEANAVNTLQNWVNSGAHRRDDNPRDGHYDDAEAIKIMDAWWPKALTAAFQPTIGDGDANKDVFSKVQAQMAFDDAPFEVRHHNVLGAHVFVRHAAGLDRHQALIARDAAGVAEGVQHQAAAHQFEIGLQHVPAQRLQHHRVYDSSERIVRDRTFAAAQSAPPEPREAS
jgi:hypothetical protein